MKTDYGFTRRQLFALCTVFFLSPALRLVPGFAARTAGRAAWLTPLVAAPFACLYAAFVAAFIARRQDGEAAPELILRALGARAGRAALIGFAGWFTLYGAFTLRAGAERIISTMYPESGTAFFIVVLGVMSLVAALDAPRTLVRAANIFLAAVLGVLALVLGFAFFSVDAANLVPVRASALPRALMGGAATLDVATVPLYAACFLSPLCRKAGGERGAGVLWALGVSALMCALLAATVGTFGAELTARLTHPFFSLVKNLRFFDTLERVEAFVVSLWVFTDFTVVSVCFIAAQHSLRLALGRYVPPSARPLFDLRSGRWLIWLVAAAATAFALVLAPESSTLEHWSRTLIPLANAAVAFAVLPIIYIVGRIRKRL